MFWLFGSLGVLWCLLFAAWFRNRPEEKRVGQRRGAGLDPLGCERKSQAAHAGVPWRRIFASRNLWAVCLMYTFHNFVMVFHITYLPSFLKNHTVQTGRLAGRHLQGRPAVDGGRGVPGGRLPHRLVHPPHRQSPLGATPVRVAWQPAAMVCFLLCPYVSSAFWFFVVISLAGFFTDLTMGANWAVCQDIGRRYAAIVAGCMNMIGNLGGTTANWFDRVLYPTLTLCPRLGPRRGPGGAALRRGENGRRTARLPHQFLAVCRGVRTRRPVLAADRPDQARGRGRGGLSRRYGALGPFEAVCWEVKSIFLGTVGPGRPGKGLFRRLAVR